MAVLAAAPAMAADSPQKLKSGDAAVVGGWTSEWASIDGFVLRSVTEVGGCLKLGDGALIVGDHPTIDTAAIVRVHRLKPGRYAMVGVRWHAPYYDQYGVAGVSPADGDLWTLTIAPDVITDLGIWPITSPYEHRYVLGSPNPTGAQAAAKAVSDGVAPLVMATWTRLPVAAADASCPKASGP